MSRNPYPDDSTTLSTDPAEQLEFLRRRVRRLLPSAPNEDVRDLASECWVEASRVNRSEPIQNWGAMLNRIAKFRALDYLRQRRSFVSLDAEDEDGRKWGDIAVRDAPPRERLARLRFDIHEFFVQYGSPECAQLSIAYFDEVDLTDVARHLGQKSNTVTQRWKRCRDTLKARAAVDSEFLSDYRDLMDAMIESLE